MKKKYSRVITFGCYDMFHIGHLKMFQRAAALGNELYVGVYTDRGVFNDKKRMPVINEKQRLEIVQNIKCVTKAFLINDIRDKKKFVKRFNANAVVHGADHKDNPLFKELETIVPVIYLPRTPGISTTQLRGKIK